MPDEPGPDPTSDEASEDSKPPLTATDMISRNDFLLFRLQTELERLKAEASDATKKASSRFEAVDGDDEEGPPGTPEEILEQARKQIEQLRKSTMRSKKPPSTETRPREKE